jgi:hypothetical protein
VGSTGVSMDMGDQQTFPRVLMCSIRGSKVWSRVPRGSDPRMSTHERTSSSCNRQTSPLVRKSTPHQQTRNCLTVIKICSYAPDGCFIPRQTGRLTVGRNFKLRMKFLILICIVGGGVQIGSTRHVGHLLAYCTCAG